MLQRRFGGGLTDRRSSARRDPRIAILDGEATRMIPDVIISSKVLTRSQALLVLHCSDLHAAATSAAPSSPRF